MIVLIPLKDTFTIYQVNNENEIPMEIKEAEFYSITKTSDEISIVTNCKTEHKHLKSETGWKAIKVDGILDFSLVGVINDLTQPLKENNISVFVLSTFNTDYLFVKEDMFELTLEVLKNTPNIQIKES